MTTLKRKLASIHPFYAHVFLHDASHFGMNLLYLTLGKKTAAPGPDLLHYGCDSRRPPANHH